MARSIGALTALHGQPGRIFHLVRLVRDVGLGIGAGVGDDVAYGVFDWVDLSGILLVLALIGAVGLAWLWPGNGE